MRRRAEQRGFTLIEVLVAFTMAGLLLVAVLRLLSVGMTGSRTAEAYTKATILADSTLEALGTASPLVDGAMADLDDGPFRIRATVERYRDDDVTNGDDQYLVLYRLSATVSWREAGQPRAVSLSTLRLGPPPQ